MSEPTTTLVVTGSSVAASILLGFPLDLVVFGLGGAFVARALASNDQPKTILSFFYAAVSLIASGMLAGMLGDVGGVVLKLFLPAWFPELAGARRTAGFLLGIGAQSIVELVQAAPRIAQANLSAAGSAVITSLSSWASKKFGGKGEQP